MMEPNPENMSVTSEAKADAKLTTTGRIVKSKCSVGFFYSCAIRGSCEIGASPAHTVVAVVISASMLV